MGYIYCLKIGNIYKFGKAQNWDERWEQYQRYSPFKLKVVFKLPIDEYHEVEKTILRFYKRHLLPGKNEWYRLTPRHVWRVKRYLQALKPRTKPLPNPLDKGLERANPVWDLPAARLNSGS